MEIPTLTDLGWALAGAALFTLLMLIAWLIKYLK
jgi:hypothetical protein